MTTLRMGGVPPYIFKPVENWFDLKIELLLVELLLLQIQRSIGSIFSSARPIFYVPVSC